MIKPLKIQLILLYRWLVLYRVLHLSCLILISYLNDLNLASRQVVNDFSIEHFFDLQPQITMLTRQLQIYNVRKYSKYGNRRTLINPNTLNHKSKINIKYNISIFFCQNISSITFDFSIHFKNQCLIIRRIYNSNTGSQIRCDTIYFSESGVYMKGIQSINRLSFNGHYLRFIRNMMETTIPCF